MTQPDQIEVPLFPLPNVVLFPGVMLPLHIFEERYKTMIGACIDESAPFGVVLFEGKEETPGTIRKVGVLARVIEVERLPDGRMNLLSEGEVRFRIMQFTSSTPYWKGLVELVSDQVGAEETRAALRADLASLYLAAYEKGLKLTGEQPKQLQLPTSSETLSFMVSYVLEMPTDQKQRLLEMTSTDERLRALIAYLRDANERLDQQLRRQRVAEVSRGNGRLGRPSPNT